jgi:LPXTG-site transpeptidase (sortase) family protein
MKLAKVNNLLLALIILINGYIIVAPVLPELSYSAGAHNRAKLQTELNSAVNKKQSSAIGALANNGGGNRVIVPSMGLDEPIVDGPESQQYKILDKGSIWRFSWGSTPDKGSNTILIGHRFTYTNPRGVFYFINKVAVGDSIGVIWNNVVYKYQVVSTTEVPANDTSIEKPSKNPELTMFSCTPLWLPKNRQVVVADLMSQS